MIRIHYDYDRDHHHLHIAGHAGYAPIGSDIVCAGVSAIACALTEHLEALDVVDRLICRTGDLKMLSRRCGESDAAFAMALAGWKAIRKAHPGYVEINMQTPSTTPPWALFWAVSAGEWGQNRRRRRKHMWVRSPGM